MRETEAARKDARSHARSHARQACVTMTSVFKVAFLPYGRKINHYVLVNLQTRESGGRTVAAAAQQASGLS